MCLLGDVHAIHDLKGDAMPSVGHQQHPQARVEQLAGSGVPASQARLGSSLVPITTAALLLDGHQQCCRCLGPLAFI